MNDQREESYWSRFADSYDKDGEYIVGKPILQAIEEKLLSEKSLGDAVEFGCGTGYFTKAIARNARHMVATDLSDEMLDAAHVRLKDIENISIQKADCSSTSFPGERFDSVFMLNLIHVIKDPIRCLEESFRILRRGGSITVIDFTGYGMNLLNKMKLGFRYLKTWGLPPRQGKDKMSKKELVSLVEEAGFKVKYVYVLEYGVNALYLKAEKI
jgi:ubiquinone/menaquinone biosynthesis C-methylase UbiE